LIVPTEKVTFRVLTFPFQDKKKIRQILPFEIENEIFGNVEDVDYTYTMYRFDGGEDKVVIMFVEHSYLAALHQLFNEWEILLKNVDCAAYLLFTALPILTQQLIFQIYLGSDESFINQIHGDKLLGVKLFPNRIPDFLGDYRSSFSLDLSDFLIKFATHTGNEEPTDKAIVKQHKIFKSVKNEIQWLCAQFNLFLRINHHYGDCQIFLYGVFGGVIEWTGTEFEMRKFPLSEARDYMSSSTMLPAKPEIPEAKKPVHNEVEQNFITQTEITTDSPPKEGALVTTRRLRIPLEFEGRLHWGIIGDLQKHALNHLEGGELSFYSEGSPVVRFLRKYRKSLIINFISILLITGIAIGNFYLKTKLSTQEIEYLDKKVILTLQGLVDKTEGESVKLMMISVKNNIIDTREKIEVSKKFAQRDYRYVTFLNNLSKLFSDDITFQVDRLEYSEERFSINGVIESYDSLQLLKNGLSEIEEFKNKRLIENNHNTPNGIVYKVSLEL